jgi:hypothetical protein
VGPGSLQVAHLSSAASLSESRSIKSASLFRATIVVSQESRSKFRIHNCDATTTPRRVTESPCHRDTPHVVLNALRAAFTARSTSAAEPCAKSSCFSPVAGLMVAKVSLDEEGYHSLLLRCGGDD